MKEVSIKDSLPFKFKFLSEDIVESYEAELVDDSYVRVSFEDPDAGAFNLNAEYTLNEFERFFRDNQAEIIHYTEPKSALRYNEGKPQLSYILDAMPALKDMVEVMEFGSKKYSRNNWMKGFPKEKLLDSLLRHVSAFYDGEDIDPESGKPHVGHIMCNAMFLAYHYGSHSKYFKEKGDD